MFSFIANLTNYGPKSFKGKAVKDILAMSSSKVPDDFFTDAYTQAHLQAFIDADLTEEQENAIDLLSDLKNKPEIIRKCYDKRKKRSGQQQAPAQQAPAQQAPAQQAPAQTEQEEEQEEEQTSAPVQESVQEEEQNVQPGDQKPLVGGGRRRKGTRKGKRSNKKSKRTRRSKKGKKSKRVRFSV